MTDAKYHNVTEEIKKVLEQGFIYLIGRDKDLRPIILLDCTGLTSKYVILYYLIFRPQLKLSANHYLSS